MLWHASAYVLMRIKTRLSNYVADDHAPSLHAFDAGHEAQCVQ